MNLTAAIPLLATSTLWIGESPPSALQNSSTSDGEDISLLLDILLGVPFIWSGSATIVASLKPSVLEKSKDKKKRLATRFY
jgi:hypothetical protein